MASSAWVAFSPDNRWLAVAGSTYELREAGSWKLRYSVHRNPPTAPGPLAFSADGRTLAVARVPALVDLLAVETGEVLATLEAPRTAQLYYLRFSPDGGQLFALEWDQQVQVWDLRRLREELRKLGLDWPAPPLPRARASAPSLKPITVSLASAGAQ